MGVRAKWLAGAWTGVGEFALGFVAAVVDPLQTFRDDGLEFPDLLGLFGVFDIHRCFDVKGDVVDDRMR